MAVEREIVVTDVSAEIERERAEAGIRDLVAAMRASIADRDGLLTFVREVRLPAWAVPVVGLLASASLYIYLVQFPILDLVPHALGATLTALAAGCLIWRLADRPVRRLQDLLLRPGR